MSTLKQFRYFVTIVETGRFIAASEQLFIAQSALSRQMMLLEDELGFLIFDRSEKKIKLTTAGDQFYRDIKKQLSALQNTILSAQNLAKGKGRIFRIAHSSSVILNQDKLKLFKQLCIEYQIEIEIETLASELQVEAIENGSLDIGFIRPPVLASLEHLNHQTVYSSKLCVAVCMEQPALNQQKVKLSDLKDIPFVSMPHSDRGGLSYLAANLCLSHGFSPQPALIRSRKITQLQLVSQNLGICIVPQDFESVLPNNVRLIELDHESRFSPVVLLWKKETDSLLQCCVEEIFKSFYDSKA
ncbi:LysR family transcriptional regulator [Acinetobacter sp.]|uniref:LysR family transcriptional regulator n=1 Tax=Acinetobacter sp. TaxID=472 RepID=UPI000C0B0F40|nr:LysR family transcriptional regulator [Acinetobacter sp.]MAK31707.1 LysR family transcriptional regulator [Acinetobacter sp.]